MANYKHNIGVLGCSIIVAMALLFGATEATEHVVGGSYGWNLPPNQTFYSDWATSNKFFVGDSLVFILDVDQKIGDVSMEEFENCTIPGIQFGGSNMNDTRLAFNLLEARPRYFISTDNNKENCERGQKFSINVEWPNSASSPSAQPPSSSSAPSTLSFSAAFLSTILASYFFTSH